MGNYNDLGINGEDVKKAFTEAYKNCRMDYRIILSESNANRPGTSIGFAVQSLRGTKPMDRFNDYYYIRKALEEAGFLFEGEFAQVNVRVRARDNRPGQDNVWFDTFSVWIGDAERMEWVKNRNQANETFSKKAKASESDNIPF